MGYACVLQQDQTDCAAAALATVASHYGVKVGIGRLWTGWVVILQRRIRSAGA